VGTQIYKCIICNSKFDVMFLLYCLVDRIYDNTSIGLVGHIVHVPTNIGLGHFVILGHLVLYLDLHHLAKLC